MACNIFIMRHGDADKQPGYPERMLTPLGFAQSDASASFIRDALAGEELDVILQSPLLRSKQTAEEVAKQVKALEIETCDLIRPGSNPDVFLNELESRIYNADPHDINILIVSHLPFVADFCYLSIREDLEFYGGAVAHIRAERQEDLLQLKFMQIFAYDKSY